MFTRREFIARFGGAAAATAAVYALPEILRVRGWWSAAYALEPDVVLDTYNGLAAMLWPGNDDYSVAQGEATDRAGAIAANAGHHIITLLDQFVPAPDNAGSNNLTLPLSGVISSAMNSVALTINPVAIGGVFVSPFARLSFTDKVATWRRLEEDTQSLTGPDVTHSLGVLQFVFGNLPAFVQFLAFSEIDVFDPATRTLRRRPVGWDHTGYLGSSLVTADGWDEFKGYYQNRQRADD